MNTKQIELVQQSFAQLAPAADMVATLFYDRFFALSPTARPLFEGGMEKQKAMFMQTLAVIVVGLGQPEKILPVAKGLAERHVGYGVRPEYFERMGAALIWALERSLGDAYTPEVNDAWFAAYTMLSSAMIEAMNAR